MIRNVFRKFSSTKSEKTYDAIILGAGHNGLSVYFSSPYLDKIAILPFYLLAGLIAASYLSKAGLRVLVLEKRAVVGGAAVTEIVDDKILNKFGLEVKMSRASYLAGLLRPVVIKELELGSLFTYLPRSPSSFTPTRYLSSVVQLTILFL